MESKNEALELREMLLDQMKRLANPNADLEKEMKRADALAKVGSVIVNSHKQEVDMLKLAQRQGGKGAKTISLATSRNQKRIGNG